MNTIILLALLITVIGFEALTDACNYLSWTKQKQPYGYYYHGFQVILMFFLGLTGYWLKGVIDLTFIHLVSLFVLFSSFHLLLFDVIYNFLLSSDVPQGSTSLWDVLILKTGLNPNGLVWNLIKLILAFVSIIWVSNYL